MMFFIKLCPEPSPVNITKLLTYPRLHHDSVQFSVNDDAEMDYYCFHTRHYIGTTKVIKNIGCLKF